MELHLTATGCHLPYGITQCYLPPDTSEHTPPSPQPDRLVLDWPTIKGGGLSKPRPRVQRACMMYYVIVVYKILFILLSRKTLLKVHIHLRLSIDNSLYKILLLTCNDQIKTSYYLYAMPFCATESHYWHSISASSARWQRSIREVNGYYTAGLLE